jgi:hypothetical protein
MRDHDSGRSTGDAAHAMMFGDPISLKTERFGVPREVGGIGQRLRHGAAFDDRHQIEQGITCHARKMGAEPRSRNPAGIDRRLVPAVAAA